tara:strand:+ start:1479 stop:1841 length:363 start_codon:yes stop_codon:yes gene_type:complete
MRKGGAIREVETMCQSGIRTANYRAFASEWKKIEENDLVMVDLGCIYKGYSSDMTRTWLVGNATDEQKKIANDLYEVHGKLMNFIKPGVQHEKFTIRFEDDLLVTSDGVENLNKIPKELI